MAVRLSDAATLGVLHAGFALTGVLHAIGGALLPSITQAFHLSDKQSGLLFSLYFLGTALGALFCVGRYAQLMGAGFLVLAAACVGIAHANLELLRPLFFVLGIGVGIPMSAVSMFTGRKFADRSAAPLTFLNFSWSAGALLAPLLAAQLLLKHTYRDAYQALAVAALAASIACWIVLQDPPARPAPERHSGIRNVGWIVLFSVLTFLEVGIENTTATWLATYSMRGERVGAAGGAASSALYWTGFLVSRGLFSLVLLRRDSKRILRGAVAVALIAAALLIALPGSVERGFAMLTLGAALAPVFPLMLSRFFARAGSASDSRWILSICGFGGSVLPWLTGWLSGSFSSLRIGLATAPAALVCILLLLPLALNDRARQHAT
ncbi:MFS transporter [Occallatibacter riparius]|uniref:MFS transporter n=1 Tax=Occallatibacter riparius TaxID=1002689 RepID=A0A9J7BL21_9BACT|nr:MFS transporter [Occallatibacter riparius]UWZ81949.1 MFS transporter [Occallatibacter riparius]